MPKRWLSTRGQRDRSEGQMPMTTPRQGNFDFAFESNSNAISKVQSPTTSPVLVRPTTSTGDESRSKKKLRLDTAFGRPRSSEGLSPIMTKKLHLTRLEDGMIGVAIGSPGHPPDAFTSLPYGNSPANPHHAFTEAGPFLLQSPQASRWKKFGSLFRSKSTVKSSKLQNVPQTDPDTKKLGLPIDRKPWRNPKSPPNQQEEFPKPSPSTASSTTNVDTSTDRPVSVWPSFISNEENTDRELPKLELMIPQTPLDRFSVMFKDVDGARSSTLLARRNQNLKTLKTNANNGGSPADASKLPVTNLARPATSPTVSSPPSLNPDSRPVSSAGSKYSLFPSYQPQIKQIQPLSATKARLRSLTAPSKMSPKQETFEDEMPSLDHVANVIRNQSENAVISPDDTIASTADRDAAPWNSAESVNRIPSSRTSAEEEIFFDVKSFRDSKGADEQQFVMTRPDSMAMQLARSQSNARKLKAAQSSPPIDTEDLEPRESSRTSIQIEETIAAIEKLTSPSKAHLPLSSPAIFELDAVETCLRERPDSTSSNGDSIIIAVDRKPPPLSTLQRKPSHKTRLESMNIDVPSPVIEQAEEASLKSPLADAPIPEPLSTSRSEQSQEVSPLSEDAPESLEKSSTEMSQGLPTPPSRSPPLPPVKTTLATPPSPSKTPPPVPVKDSKFIPLSKFAARDTANIVTERTGLRPTPRGRSATLNFASFSERAAQLPLDVQPGKLERSSTMPDLNAAPHFRKLPQTMSSPMIVGPGSKEHTAMVAYAPPAAEVSIARTISLSRRPSQKVLVPGPLSRKASQKSGNGRISIDDDEAAVERQTKAQLPVVREVEKGHKLGRSMNLIVEMADVAAVNGAETKGGEEEQHNADSAAVSPTSLTGADEEDVEAVNFSC